MKVTTNIEVNTRGLNRILKRLPGLEEENNRAIAFRIEAGAKAKSPVDTGANQNSIYTVCGSHDGFTPLEGSHPLPKPRGSDAHVGPSMEYSIYLEFGTRRMSARPYLVPSVREVEHYLATQWGNIADE